MKKILFLAAASLTLFSCAKKEIAADRMIDGTQPIEFSSYTGREATKADSPSGISSFKVTALLNSEGYFENDTFSWDGSSKYTSSETHYWPETGTLDFYAVTPTTVPNMNTSAKTVAFTGINGTTDFCTAVATGQSYVEGTPTALSFGHELSKIRFTFAGKGLTGAGKNDSLSYEITSVKISANGTSTFTLGSSESWTQATGPKLYSAISSTVTLNKTTTKSSATSPLYLIPNQPSTANTVKLSVKYVVKENGQIIDNKYASTDSLTVDLTSTTNLWGINKSVLYNLTLGPSTDASPITFTAETTDWNSTTEVDPIVPSEAMKGEFSVSSTKKVRFAKGNLWCNKTTSPVTWAFEENQQSSPTTFSNSHIGHFFWSKTLSVVIPTGTWASDPDQQLGDSFYFDGIQNKADGIMPQWRTLTKDEIDYLINQRSSVPQNHLKTVEGVEGYVFYPDGYTGDQSENTFSAIN